MCIYEVYNEQYVIINFLVRDQLERRDIKEPKAPVEYLEQEDPRGPLDQLLQ